MTTPKTSVLDEDGYITVKPVVPNVGLADLWSKLFNYAINHDHTNK